MSRQVKNIDKLKIIFDDSINLSFNSICSESSSLLQNIISNIIRKKILIFQEKQMLSKTLINTCIDITVDISHTMSEEQRKASLLICTGLGKAFCKYGIKIRISVFAERDNVWLLTNDFSTENIDIQLLRLRDTLASKKRIQSFPADSLKN